MGYRVLISCKDLPASALGEGDESQIHRKGLFLLYMRALREDIKAVGCI